LAGLFILYCGQDPSQVYRFYSYDYIWSKGIGYLQYSPSFGGYLTIVLVTSIFFILGMISLIKFTHTSYVESRDELILNRKFSVAVPVLRFLPIPLRINFWPIRFYLNAWTRFWPKKSPTHQTKLNWKNA
jgi:hypothetical protein